MEIEVVFVSVCVCMITYGEIRDLTKSRNPKIVG